jgi:hypothetical protein
MVTVNDSMRLKSLCLVSAMCQNAGNSFTIGASTSRACKHQHDANFLDLRSFSLGVGFRSARRLSLVQFIAHDFARGSPSLLPSHGL